MATPYFVHQCHYHLFKNTETVFETYEKGISTAEKSRHENQTVKMLIYKPNHRFLETKDWTRVYWNGYDDHWWNWNATLSFNGVGIAITFRPMQCMATNLSNSCQMLLPSQQKTEKGGVPTIWAGRRWAQGCWRVEGKANNTSSLVNTTNERSIHHQYRLVRYTSLMRIIKEQEDKVLKRIGYWSRSLHKAETKFDITHEKYVV